MAMYAVVGIWNIDPSLRDQQDQGLHELVIPSVRNHPGFVVGYWMRDVHSGKGHTTIVLDSEQSAQSFKESVLSNSQNQAKAGITADSLAVVEIIAQAQR
jgi:hypothetical protein